MQLVRLVLSLVGLIAIALGYITHDLYFLILAIIAFIAGLYIMGALGRRSDRTQKLPPKKNSQNQKKNRSEK
ncbi:MAG: hypothetical protein OK457_09670 [Thaumarchaeota archaeon]|nr:hypothetical protein [Nitrososphaerota archaeon]